MDFTDDELITIAYALARNGYRLRKASIQENDPEKRKKLNQRADAAYALSEKIADSFAG